MNYKRAAIQLWQIIDDIDTYSDLAKDNDVLYRKLVNKKQGERHAILVTDGYDLFTPKSEGYENITNEQQW